MKSWCTRTKSKFECLLWLNILKKILKWVSYGKLRGMDIEIREEEMVVEVKLKAKKNERVEIKEIIDNLIGKLEIIDHLKNYSYTVPTVIKDCYGVEVKSSIKSLAKERG